MTLKNKTSMNFIKVTVPILESEKYVPHPSLNEYYINASCIVSLSRHDKQSVTYIVMGNSSDDEDYYTVMETPKEIFKLIAELEDI